MDSIKFYAFIAIFLIKIIQPNLSSKLLIKNRIINLVKFFKNLLN